MVGTSFPMNPPVTYFDMASLQERVNMDEVTDLESIPQDYSDFMAMSREKFKGKRINMGDRIIEIN
jgi:hypothetical protein